MGHRRNKQRQIPGNGPSVQVQNQIQSLIAQQESYSGPIPHPALLAKFEEILPGSADRIIRQAESQTEHRQELEKIVIGSNVREAKAGRWSAWSLALVAIGSSVFLAMNGHDATASVLAGTGLFAVVSPFLVTRSKQDRELLEKRRAVPPT